MDKESISRLWLDYISGIDIDSSDEIYNPSTTNHIIFLKLIKQSNMLVFWLIENRNLKENITCTIFNAFFCAKFKNY